MIDQQNVFIIGAGASVPYGFPDGKKIIQDVCSNIINDYNQLYTNDNKTTKIPISQINLPQEFSKCLLVSGTDSIDRFLSVRQEFSFIGRISIVLEILKNESIHRNKLFSPLTRWEGNWFDYLFHKMISGVTQRTDLNKIKFNNVTFITFNYDRLLEYSFLIKITNLFGLTSAEASEIVAKIPIYHINGKLGPLDEYQSDGITYGKKIQTLSEAKKIVRNLNVIYDQRSKCESIIQALIQEAQNIFFLGFGYDPTNLKAVFIPDGLKRNQNIFGTALNYTENEVTQAIGKFTSNTNLVRGSIRLFKEYDCLQLLRNFFN